MSGDHAIEHRTAVVDGLSVCYREAGEPTRPRLLLGGFPASSHQFRNLIPALADRSTSFPRIKHFYDDKVVHPFAEPRGMSRLGRER